MKKLIILLLVVLTSRATITKVNSVTDSKMSKLIGQKIMIIGTAVNAKLGTLLMTKNGFTIWIDEEKSWPKGYYYDDNTGKKLEVTGILIQKYDLPIFIQKDGDLPKSGIPVPEGTDLREASRRYLLKNATWEIISD